MGGIRPCELNKRLSGRLSSQMRELGPCRPPFAAYAARGRFCPEHGARSCRPPTTRWAAFAPVDRINAPLDGFHPKRGKLVRAGRHSPSMEAVGRFRPQPWRSCPRRTPRPLRIRPPRACRIASDPHFFRNGSFTNRWGAPVSPVTRIHPPIKEKSLKTAFLQNH